MRSVTDDTLTDQKNVGKENIGWVPAFALQVMGEGGRYKSTRS